MLFSPIKFELPPSLNASAPPERRGIRRDYVKLMVLDRQTGQTSHSMFYHLEQFLKPGDLFVLNSSRTIPAVLHAKWIRGEQLLQDQVEVRLARRIDETSWEALLVAEGGQMSDQLIFSQKLQAQITKTDHPPFVSLSFSQSGDQLYDLFYRLGEPIRYEYIDYPWSLDYYQTVFANAPGSVEMPSAGRAFSWELLFKLKCKGVKIAFIQLHTGLSYLLDDRWHQDPRDHYEEFFLSQETAEMIQSTKEQGGRVIAVGTTVVRSLESAVDPTGQISPKSGWTNLKIDSSYSLKVVDGLLTGLHEPEASHLELLAAFVPEDLLLRSYQEAIDCQYLWHEFGDMNLIF